MVNNRINTNIKDQKNIFIDYFITKLVWFKQQLLLFVHQLLFRVNRLKKNLLFLYNNIWLSFDKALTRRARCFIRPPGSAGEGFEIPRALIDDPSRNRVGTVARTVAAGRLPRLGRLMKCYRGAVLRPLSGRAANWRASPRTVSSNSNRLVVRPFQC